MLSNMVAQYRTIPRRRCSNDGPGNSQRRSIRAPRPRESMHQAQGGCKRLSRGAGCGRRFNNRAGRRDPRPGRIQGW